jgi:hypothetical protein
MDEVGIASSFGSSGPWCGRAWACGETLCPQPRAPRGVTADAIERLEREQPAAMATWRHPRELAERVRSTPPAHQWSSRDDATRLAVEQDLERGGRA